MRFGQSLGLLSLRQSLDAMLLFRLIRYLTLSDFTFDVHAQRWRELAAQVKPPMAEKEMISTFLNTLKDPYYSHLIGHTTSSFADLVIVGERVEDGVKSGRLVDVQALQQLLEQSGSGPGQQSAEVKMITSAAPKMNQPYRKRMYVQPTSQQSYVISTVQPQFQNTQPQASSRKEAKVVAEKRRFDPVPMPLSQLLPQLIATNLVTTVPPKPVTDPPQKGFDPNARCDYHMGSPGHWTDRCFRLRHKVQDLLDQELLNFETDQGSKPNGNSNDIGLSSNKISSKGRIFDPSQLITPPGTRVRLKIKEGEDLPEVAMIASTGGKPAEEALVNKPSEQVAGNIEQIKVQMKEMMLLMNTLVAAQGTPGTQFITPMLQQSVLTGTIPTSRNTVNTSPVGKKPRKIDLHPERAVHIKGNCNQEATRLNPASPSGSQREGSTKLLGKSKKFKNDSPHVTARVAPGISLHYITKFGCTRRASFLLTLLCLLRQSLLLEPKPPLSSTDDHFEATPRKAFEFHP